MIQALAQGVRTGLGSDVAGGYTADQLVAMRSAVMVSRMREGLRKEGGVLKQQIEGEDEEQGGALKEKPGGEDLGVNWKETLYLATCGGALALELPQGAGTFAIGAPFDAQLSESRSHSVPRSSFLTTIFASFT